jgi:hypothetical protein
MAWLSVCLLAGAWGPELTRDNRLAWTSFGLLGLTAALGLDGISRLRRARKEQSRQQTVAVVQQQRLVKIARESRTAEALRDAIRWVADAAQRHSHRGAEPMRVKQWDYTDRRSEARLDCWMPVDLLPSAYNETAAPMTAYIHNVSSTGIRLCHSEPVEAAEAVLKIRPEDVEGLALLMTQCWTRSTSDGWHQTGWKLLAVLSEARSEETASPLVALSAAC